jgi:hypothetical protein
MVCIDSCAMGPPSGAINIGIIATGMTIENHVSHLLEGMFLFLSFLGLCFYDRLPFAFKFCQLQIEFDSRSVVCSDAAFVDLRFYTLSAMLLHSLILTFPIFVGKLLCAMRPALRWLNAKGYK